MAQSALSGGGYTPRSRSGSATLEPFLLFCVLGTHCGSPAEGVPKLPEISASSKYIDYSTTGDAAMLCVDDLLFREDRFIEAVSAYLAVPPPSGRIRHLQVEGVEFDDPRTWPCDNGFDCYIYFEEEDLGLIRSASVAQYHELVHAVDIPAFGSGHRTLAEGLAEYLGTARRSDAVLSNFPERFKAMVTESSMPNNYLMAMHFVGSLLQREGVAKFLRFRAALAADAGLPEFEKAFIAVYGGTLDDALTEMSKDPVEGTLIPAGCPGNDDADVQHIPSTDGYVIDTPIDGQCGDPFFIGFGSIGAEKIFTLDVPSPGFYILTVTGPGASQPTADLQACPRLESYLGNTRSDGSRLIEVLYSGRHRLSVFFPQNSAAINTANLRLAFDSPL